MIAAAPDAPMPRGLLAVAVYFRRSPPAAPTTTRALPADYYYDRPTVIAEFTSHLAHLRRHALDPVNHDNG